MSDAPKEPESLREMWSQATRDLKAPTAEAHLRWVFWHARCVGREKVAEIGLEELNLRIRGLAAMASAHITSSSIKQAIEADMPAPSLIATTREMLVEASACVEASSRVVTMLGAAVLQARARAAHAGPSGQRVGQSSHGGSSGHAGQSPGARTSTAPRPATPAPSGHKGPAK